MTHKNTFWRCPRFWPLAQPWGMDPGFRTHGMKAGPPGYLWSKYECFLMSGCRDYPCTLYRWAKKDIKHCLLDTPCTVMLNKENYYREYKGHTKWLSLISSHFAKVFFFGMTLLHAHAHYIGIVCAKYQKASVKALVQVDFLMYALSKHKHNPYLIGNRKKWLSLQSHHYVKN